ncbi:GTP-binding protein [Aureitalea marina]|uniref:GTP-binding protein n=1 Tax=Aureitalea marina TaxID=930804 RepID=A0A2S7KM14_9FLAO|nr:GTP-binding protein [Aureitalea marina]PQB03613.1 GTP-binding protein [Aureitalea marina]
MAHLERKSDIALRPRFNYELPGDKEHYLSAMEKAGQNQDEFVVTRLDDHVFVRFPKTKQHYWSPQLEMEISSFEEGISQLRGLFGPKPAVWTMFMFLHFVVATLFIVAGAWAYSNYSLEESFALQLTIMGLLIIAWFVLYFAGRMGRLAGKEEINRLFDFMKKTLEGES